MARKPLTDTPYTYTALFHEQFVLCTVQCTVYIMYWYNVHCALSHVQCTLYTLHCSLQRPHQYKGLLLVFSVFMYGNTDDNAARGHNQSVLIRPSLMRGLCM